jgi:transposase
LTLPACLPPLGREGIGPNPTDRAKRGSKHHLLVDGRGLPLAIRLSGANDHDSQHFIPLLDAAPAVSGRRGRPRCRPIKLHADKGYDFPFCREYLRRRGICPRIARRGIESKERLGRYRWVVERSIAWLHAFRRLRIRYEKRADIHLGFLKIACAVIAWRFIKRFC